METAMLDSWTCNAILNETNNLLTLQQQFAVFNGCKGELKRDGNMWCATAGEWPQDNITGFGKSPAEAVAAFYSEYYTHIKPQPEGKGKEGVE